MGMEQGISKKLDEAQMGAAFSRPSASPNNDQFTDDSIATEIAFLLEFGIGRPTLEAATRRAAHFQISAAVTLIAYGAISESDYARCCALELGIEFSDFTSEMVEPIAQVPDPETLLRMARMVQTQEHRDLDVIAQQFDGRLVNLAPDMRKLSAFSFFFVKYPNVKHRLRITTLRANKESIIRRCRNSLLFTAVHGLREQLPHFSARRVITVAQAIILFVCLQAIAVVAFLSSSTVLFGAHLIASTFYLGCVGLRAYCALQLDSVRKWNAHIEQQSHNISDSELPFYSIVVALYQEQTQVPDLISSLLRLDWPYEKQEVLLVCEEDDAKTIKAIQTYLAGLCRPHISLITVPFAEPRTKPKALNYALQLCRGDYVVIYDAEDRPAKNQLRQAANRFANENSKLVCLQAPLMIHNHHESWLSKMFAIEYSALFDGLLPTLAHSGLPLPLGGTSNHFKKDVLNEIGGWDPYNVTEDADLGMRISRAGYTIGTLTAPTLEEAPIALSVWLKQRTRWFKGWFQTWLVHMRHPIALAKDLGFKGTLIFHLMITGMIISSLVHPFLLYFIGSWIWIHWAKGLATAFSNPLFLFDFVTIMGGYIAFSVLALRTMPQRNLQHLTIWLVTLPAYWLLLSIAAWRAAWHLIRRPHEWEKTPHRLQGLQLQKT